MDDLDSLYDQLDAYANTIRNRDKRIAQLEADLAFQKSVTDAARQHQAELLERAENAEARIAQLESALRTADHLCIARTGEVNELRGDAERYRWLRDRAESDSYGGDHYGFPIISGWEYKPGPELNERYQSVDDALDAAIELAAKEKA